MSDDKYPDAQLREILSTVKTIAMVGASNKPERASHEVFGFLVERGYRVVGVNPGLAGQTIYGAPVFASLADIPYPVDMVEIFRKSSEAGGVVDAAIALQPGPKVIWMQNGVCDEAAGERARARGFQVIMDRCPKTEIRRLFGEAGAPSGS
jgi:predicted CoA-binding protein